MAHKLLIVDDDKDVLENLKGVLVKAGYEVSGAYDGEEALAKLGSFDPDMVLLDLMMPKLNGFEALKAIREKHKDKWRPVIIMSARSEMDVLEKCYDLEADHYLTKPFSVEDMLHGIKTMLALIPARKSE